MGSIRAWEKEKLALEPEIGYFETSMEDRQCIVNICSVRVASLRDINLGVNLLYRLPIEAVRVRVGGGFAAHLLKLETSRRISPPRDGFDLADSDSKVREGAQLALEVGFPVTRRLEFFVSNRLEFVHESADEMKVFAGIRFHFD